MKLISRWSTPKLSGCASRAARCRAAAQFSFKSVSQSLLLIWELDPSWGAHMKRWDEMFQSAVKTIWQGLKKKNFACTVVAAVRLEGAGLEERRRCCRFQEDGSALRCSLADSPARPDIATNAGGLTILQPSSLEHLQHKQIFILPLQPLMKPYLGGMCLRPLQESRGGFW